MNKWIGVGLIFIALGFFLILTPRISYATMMYIPENTFWRQINPSGTSTSPSQITATETMSIYVELVFYDSVTSASFPDPKVYAWTVTVSINGVTQLLTLQGTYPNVDGRYATALFHNPTWQVPSGGGASYTFVWTVQIPNGPTVTKTTYAVSANPILPDGNFQINNQNVNQESVIYLLSPSVNFKFVPTQAADKLVRAWIDIWKQNAKTTVDLTKQTDGTWTTTYTLTSTGRYDLYGYIWDGMSSEGIRKMTLITYFSTEPPVVGNIPLILGIAFLAIGIPSIIVGQKKAK